MIKKIYSAVDAEEVQTILDKGLTVKGYFGSSLHRVIDQDENDYLAQEVVEVNETRAEKRFKRADGTSHALFGLVSVIRETDITDEEVK